MKKSIKVFKEDTGIGEEIHFCRLYIFIHCPDGHLLKILRDLCVQVDF